MKNFLKKTGVVGIISLAIPVLVVISIFFTDDSHIGFSFFLVAVSVLQIFDLRADMVKNTTKNNELIGCCKKSGHLLLGVSVIYAILLVTLKNHVVIISLIALIGYFVNGLMLYRNVRKLEN